MPPVSQCVYCGIDLDDDSHTDDHVIPLSRGGSNLRTNMAPSCLPCNMAKGPLTASEYLATRDDPEDLEALRRTIEREINARPENVQKQRDQAERQRRRVKSGEEYRTDSINRKATRSRQQGAREAHDRSVVSLRQAAADRFRQVQIERERQWEDTLKSRMPMPTQLEAQREDDWLQVFGFGAPGDVTGSDTIPPSGHVGGRLGTADPGD